MEKAELKILLYRYLDSIEYEYTRAHSVAYHNFTIEQYTDKENLCESLLNVFSAQRQKEAVFKISKDIARILDNDKEL